MSDYQLERPNPFKPSVIKKHSYWMTRVYDANGCYVSDVSVTQVEAFDKALALAAQYMEAKEQK